MKRRSVLIGAAAALAGGPALAAASLPFVVSGRAKQGGFLIGRTLPGAPVAVDGQTVATASPAGLFIVGFDRDAGPRVDIAVLRYGAWEARTFAVAPTDYDVQRINGLPSDQVAPQSPALLARIAREAELKAAAFASVDAGEGFRDGFVWPVKMTRISGRFGGQRVLNGVAQRPHYGIDLAAPAGAPITSPSRGLVVLAEPDMHFEGGLTLIDHGQGMIGMYLHQSKLLVRRGDLVERGQTIGAVGRTGRATGPHLCWRLRWRGRNLDPSLLVGGHAPSGAKDDPLAD